MGQVRHRPGVPGVAGCHRDPPPITNPARPEWIAPGVTETDSKPPTGYVISLARLPERGFGYPAGRFIRVLCHHYEVELHNFAPNAIS